MPLESPNIQAPVPTVIHSTGGSSTVPKSFPTMPPDQWQSLVDIPKERQTKEWVRKVLEEFGVVVLRGAMTAAECALLVGTKRYILENKFGFLKGSITSSKNLVLKLPLWLLK
jgi:hypothetical protein